MTVDGPLMKLGRSLQKRHGECFASEAGWRAMIAEDTGHCPGVGTIPEALDRLAHQGECRVEWLYGKGIMPNGEQAIHGTTLVRWANDRHERRAFAKQHRVRNRDPRTGRRHGVYRRPDVHSLELVDEQRRAVQKSLQAPPATTTAVDVERMRADARARLGALYGQHEGETLLEAEKRWRETKPPD